MSARATGRRSRARRARWCGPAGPDRTPARRRPGLRLWGIALEPFCPTANGSSAFQYLGALQRADLGGDLLERRGHDGQGGRELGVAVPLHDLVRDRRRLEAEEAAGLLLHVGVHVGEGAHRARQLAHRTVSARRRRRSRLRARLAVPEAALRPKRPSARRGCRGCAPRRGCPGGGGPARGGWPGSARAPRSAARRPAGAAGASAVSTTSEEVSPMWT